MHGFVCSCMHHFVASRLAEVLCALHTVHGGHMRVAAGAHGDDRSSSGSSGGHSGSGSGCSSSSDRDRVSSVLWCTASDHDREWLADVMRPHFDRMQLSIAAIGSAQWLNDSDNTATKR